MLTFKALQEKMELREEDAKHTESRDGTASWNDLEISGALCGEAGELANICKKLKRGDKIPNYKEEVGKELSDVICYATILANHLGIDLGQAVAEKFNVVSDRWNSQVKLPHWQEVSFNDVLVGELFILEENNPANYKAGQYVKMSPSVVSFYGSYWSFDIDCTVKVYR